MGVCLAYGMVGDEFFDKFFDLCVVIVESAAFLSSEYHIFNGFHFCGRTGKTNLCRVGIYESGAPLFDLQFRSGFNACCEIFRQFCHFGRRCCIFEFHYPAGIAGAAFSGAAVYSDYTRHGSHNGLHTVFETTAHGNFSVCDFEYLLGIGNLRDTEFFGNLGTDLRGIAVDSLAAAENDVVVADFFTACASE